MAGGSAIRGSRVGAGPMGEAERERRPRESMSPSGVRTGTNPVQVSPPTLKFPRNGTALDADSPQDRIRTTLRRHPRSSLTRLIWPT